jgi:hypothetical protein
LATVLAVSLSDIPFVSFCLDMRVDPLDMRTLLPSIYTWLAALSIQAQSII